MRDTTIDKVKSGELLGEISEFEHNNYKHLLSVLVIRATGGEDCDGFYKLAEK